MTGQTATQHAIYVPSHADEAIEKLPHQFHKPMILALIRAISVGVQALENQTFGLLNGINFELATGAVLDRWGAIINEPRAGLGDVTYRRFIAARILIRQASGSDPDLFRIAELLTQPSTVRVEPVYPCNIFIYVHRAVPLADDIAGRIATMLDQARPAGFRMQVIESIDGSLGFTDNPSALSLDVGKLSRNLL